MTISAKVSKALKDTGSLVVKSPRSPGSPEEACNKIEKAIKRRIGILYAHNDEIVAVFQPKKQIQDKKISDLSLRDKTYMKAELVRLISKIDGLEYFRFGPVETGPYNRAKHPGNVPAKGVSRFGTLWHKCSDVTVRAPKKSLGFGQASPFYAFIKIKAEELDKLITDFTVKVSSSPLEKRKTKILDAPTNEDGSINTEGTSIQAFVDKLKEGLAAVGEALGEEIEKAELKELDAQTNELLADLELEEEEKRGTSTDENDLSPTQREDVPEAIRRNLESQVFLNNEIVSTGAANAATVLEYYIEVLDENDPPIDPVDLKGINLIDELEKLAALKDYFEDFKDMNRLGAGDNNTVLELRGIIDFPIDPDTGDNQDGIPEIFGFDDRSPFANLLRLDPAVAEAFQPDEEYFEEYGEGSFFKFQPPFDEREPSLIGSILGLVDKIRDHDYGFVGGGGLPPRPAAEKHPAYDQLANINGDPQPVPTRAEPPPVVYDADNLPPRVIKEIDITRDAYEQGAPVLRNEDIGIGDLKFTIQYLDQNQIRNRRGSDILIQQELNFTNTNFVASIPRNLLKIHIYEAVKQPNADKIKITLDSEIKPILFETELDKIEAVGDLEFDFRPARFSGLGVSPETTKGEYEEFGSDNNGLNAFPGYTPTTWSILKNLKLINEELSKLGSGGATPWTEFLPKIFVPAVELSQEDIDQLCKKGQVERADEVSRRRAGGSTQDNKEPPLTALENPEIDKQPQKPASQVVADPSVEASRIKIKQQQKTALRETVELSVTDALVTCNSGLVKQIKSLADILKLMGRVDFATMLGALAKNLAADVLLQQAILNKLNEQGLLPEELAAEFIRCGGEVSDALDILNDLVPSILNTLNDPNALKNLAFDGLEDALKFLLPNLEPLPLVPNLDIYGFIRLLLLKGIKVALIQLLGALLREAIQELLGCNGDSLLDSLIAKAAEGLDLDIDLDAFSIKDGLNLSRLIPPIPGVNPNDLFANLGFAANQNDVEAFYDAISSAITGEELRTMIYDTPTSGQIFRTVRSVADRVFGDDALTDSQLAAFFIALRDVIPPARFDAYIPFQAGPIICDEGQLDDAANQVLENSSAMGIDPADLAKQFVDALCEAAEESNRLADLLKPGGLQKAVGSAVKDLIDNTEQPDEVKNVINQGAAVATQASVSLVKGSETTKQYLSGIKTKGPSLTEEFKFTAFKPGDFDNAGLPINKFWVVGTFDNQEEIRTRIGSETNVTYNLDNDVFVKNLKEGEDLTLQIREVTPESAVFSIAKEGENFDRQVLAEVSTAGAFSYTDIQNEAGRNLLRATLAQAVFQTERGDYADQINGFILRSVPFQRSAATEDKLAVELTLYYPNDDPEVENYIQTYRQQVVDRMNIDKVMQGISDACMESMPKNLSAGPLAVVRKDKCLAAAQIVYAELMRFYFAVVHYTGARDSRDETYFLSDQDTILTQLIVDYIARRVRKNNKLEIIEDVEKIVASLDRSPTRGRQRFFSSALFGEDKLKEFIYKCLTYFDRDDDGQLFLTSTSNNDVAEDAREYFPNGYTIGQGEEAELLTPTDKELNNFVMPLQGIVAMQIMWASEYDLPGELGLKFDDFLANAKKQFNDSKRLLAGNSLSEPEKGN